LDETREAQLSEIQTLHKNKDHLLELMAFKNNEIESLSEKLQIKKQTQNQLIQTNWREFLIDMSPEFPNENAISDEKNQNFEDLLAKYLFYSDERAKKNESIVLERISMRKKENETNAMKNGIILIFKKISLFFIYLEEKTEQSKDELTEYIKSLELKLEIARQKQEITLKENEEISATLKKLAQTKIPSLDAIVAKVKFEENEKFEKEKFSLIKDLQIKIERVFMT
jgi:hypothetical protein